MSIKEVTDVTGYAQYTSTGSAFPLSTAPATGIALPATDPSNYGNRPVAILMQAEAQNLRWRGDGVAPSTTVGMILYAGQTMMYDGPLNKIQFIQTTSGAILNITYLTGGAA